MAWLQKVILFILSTVFLFFISCESVRTKSEIDSVVEKPITQEDLVEEFFTQIRSWNSENIYAIDSLGAEISQMNSNLNFLAYGNEYEAHSFVFSANDKEKFKIFEENDFLVQDSPAKQNSYKVWRKKLNNREVLDVSIEPHPVLGWLFVVRKRGQE